MIEATFSCVLKARVARNFGKYILYFVSYGVSLALSIGLYFALPISCFSTMKHLYVVLSYVS